MELIGFYALKCASSILFTNGAAFVGNKNTFYPCQSLIHIYNVRKIPSLPCRWILNNSQSETHLIHFIHKWSIVHRKQEYGFHLWHQGIYLSFQIHNASVGVGDGAARLSRAAGRLTSETHANHIGVWTSKRIHRTAFSQSFHPLAVVSVFVFRSMPGTRWWKRNQKVEARGHGNALESQAT